MTRPHAAPDRIWQARRQPAIEKRLRASKQAIKNLTRITRIKGTDCTERKSSCASRAAQ